MRTNVGSGDGVTKRLDQPGHQQHDDQPDRDRDHRPALFGEHLAARPVARRDHRPAQPHARRAAARNTAVSSSRPCGASRPRKRSPLPASNMKPADHAEVGGVLEQHIRDRDAEQDRERDALRGHPGVVDPHLQRERAAGCLAVVGGEVVVHQLVDLAWGSDGGLHFGVAGHPQPRSSTATKKNATAVPSHHRHAR